MTTTRIEIAALVAQRKNLERALRALVAVRAETIAPGKRAADVIRDNLADADRHILRAMEIVREASPELRSALCAPHIQQ